MTDWMPKTTPAEMLARINTALDSGRTVIIGRREITPKVKAEFDAAGIALCKVVNNTETGRDEFWVYDGHCKGIPRYAFIFRIQLESSVRIY